MVVVLLLVVDTERVEDPSVVLRTLLSPVYVVVYEARWAAEQEGNDDGG